MFHFNNGSNNNLEFFFEDPLVRMGIVERFLVRVMSGTAFMLFGIMSVFFVTSPIKPLFFLGLFMLLIVLDKVLHRGQSRRRLTNLPHRGRVNLADYVSPHARKSLAIAYERAAITDGSLTLHIAATLFTNDEEVREGLSRLDVDLNEFEDRLNSYVEESRTEEDLFSLSETVTNVVTKGGEVAISGSQPFIGCGDIFVGLGLCGDKDLNRLFTIFDIKPEDLDKAMIFGRIKRVAGIRSWPKTIGGFAARHMRRRVMNRAWTARPTPTLDKFAVDYSTIARAGAFGLLIGHKDEYERLITVLSRPIKPNSLLVGEAGMGKEALVGHLAYMIGKDKVPRELFDKRLVALDIGKLIAGADQAELQLRIKQVFGEISDAGNIILFIPDIHNLSKTSPDKEISASATIIPLIVGNDFPLIGTTYPRELKEYIESDSAFSQAFDVIRVKEISEDEAIRVLIYESILLEREYKVKVTYSSIKTSVELAYKYFRSKPLPGSALDLLKDGLSYANRRGDKVLSAEDIVYVAETRVNIPIRKAGKHEAEKLLNLESLIHEKLIDQEDAVRLVSEALREYRSGLGRRGGPIGSFLFVGPTGVGKTELSKILAKLQFGSEDSMIRFDMSEYQDRTSVFQFIGSPDGAVTGLLTDRVLEKPYSLILLDEFEKAHADILNLFLQVFDDGRLTDNFGRVVSFENTIIIATSNAHSNFIKEELERGRSMSDITIDLKKKLTTVFKPELINRFSGIAVFKDLSREDILKIAKLQVRSLATTLMDSQGVKLIFDDGAISKLAELGYDPVFGARPLRQVISSKIKNPLSKLILGSKLTRGSSAVVKLVNNEITVDVQ